MATELRLEYLGAGNFQALTQTDVETANENFVPGDRVKGVFTQPKTAEQNNYFHALVQLAHENQRKQDRMQTWRHLRNHLLIRAGWCSEDWVDVGEWKPATVKALLGPIVGVIKRKADTLGVIYKPSEGRVYVYSPKSWAKADIEDAARVLDEVVSIISTEIVPGLDVDLLRREALARTQKRNQLYEPG